MTPADLLFAALAVMAWCLIFVFVFLPLVLVVVAGVVWCAAEVRDAIRALEGTMKRLALLALLLGAAACKPDPPCLRWATFWTLQPIFTGRGQTFVPQQVLYCEQYAPTDGGAQ